MDPGHIFPNRRIMFRQLLNYVLMNGPGPENSLARDLYATAVGILDEMASLSPDSFRTVDPGQTVSEPWIRARQFPNHGSGPDSFRTVDPGHTVSEPWTRAPQFPNHGYDPDRFGRYFANFFYGTFDLNRANVVRLYKQTSTMTFDGQIYHGLESIARKLTEIPFELCKHYISTVDCQPSGPAGDMLVFVSGSLHFRFAGEEHHPRFSQIFSLTLTPEGSFVIQNDIFRLNYC